MLIVLRIVLLGEEKERHFYFCPRSIYRKGGISEGTKNVFNRILIYFFFSNNPMRSSMKFSILNLIVTHSVVLSGKYQAPKLETWGVYCFGAHHSLILLSPTVMGPAEWFVLCLCASMG